MDLGIVLFHSSLLPQEVDVAVVSGEVEVTQTVRIQLLWLRFHDNQVIIATRDGFNK